MMAWWHRQATGMRFAVVAVVAIVAVNVVVTSLGTLVGREPSGPSSSSYATGDDGVAALAVLYQRHGHVVTRLRRPLAAADLDRGATLVVADPSSLTRSDVVGVTRFVTGGGQLIVAGRSTVPLVRALFGPDVRWRHVGAERSKVVAPTPDTGRAGVVVADGVGSWSSGGRSSPFLVGEGRATGLRAQVGRGGVIALADVSILHNRHLDEGDGAALALAAAGRGRPVLFDEAGHGYGSSTGSLPARWWRFLAVGTIAVLLLMWTAARRLGPPEDPARPLPPPRRDYVDALAVSLSRTREPDVALERLQRRARERLAGRLGLPPTAGHPELAAAAARAGVPAEDVAALFEPPGGAAEVVEVGRAAARHGGGAW